MRTATDTDDRPNTMANNDTSPNRIDLRLDDPKAPYVAALLAHHLQELQSVMAGYAFALNADGLSARAVTFWTAWRGTTLVGFCALKELSATQGEVKSMRAAPEARGTGVGRIMIDHIIKQARQRGYTMLCLETGTLPHHDPAVALYQKTGFVPCPPFADYAPSPYNRFMQYDLTAPTDTVTSDALRD